ncbi:MAG: leucine-rich repeat protein, partial [Kiritimatiellae bacterium]|nr:leucine-rich repeat protein [Kiritimatiellia bacterium]
MKKQIVLFAVSAFAALQTCLAATTYTTKVGGRTWYYTLSSGQATVTGVSPARGEIVVPSVLDENTVVAIASGTCSGCPDITALCISDTVLTVGRGAFSNCASLGDVALGAGVTSVNGTEDYLSEGNISGYGAFSFCTSLTNVTFGASLK